jgi:hypothetical protein
MRFNKSTLFGFLFLWIFISCENKSKNSEPVVVEKSIEKIVAPDFNADSAYAFIAKQVSFGPRVPGTPQHKACKEWLVKKLQAYTENVIIQEATVIAYNGKKLPMYNIVATFNPEAKRRILLAAHWDTRPYADQDIERIKEPILGANDGASGVGVLIEIARQLSLNPISEGVDIILFDVEDYGEPDFEEYNKRDTYCLGSQYWAKTPHIKGYTAEAGILLDMVGAKNAVFTLEGTSMRYAPKLMRDVWNVAIKLGHSRYFSFERTDPILDDHYYVNELARIPMIDIIHHERSTGHGFPSHWHTHDDNMDVIDKKTLQAVGETVLAYVRANF